MFGDQKKGANEISKHSIFHGLLTVSLFPKRRMMTVGHFGDLEASSFRGGSF